VKKEQSESAKGKIDTLFRSKSQRKLRTFSLPFLSPKTLFPPVPNASLLLSNIVQSDGKVGNFFRRERAIVLFLLESSRIFQRFATSFHRDFRYCDVTLHSTEVFGFVDACIEREDCEVRQENVEEIEGQSFEIVFRNRRTQHELGQKSYSRRGL